MSEENEVPNSFVAPSLEELAPFFPAYEIEAFIAQGGMGAVYKARQISLDRAVAIKILPREFGEDEQFRASFEAEAKAMARLNHPNLIGVFDFGDVDGMLFIIMEHVKGKALYYSIYKKAIDPAIAIKLISKISRGLAHAHGQGILHRDIKPANILLDMNADPKIGDFGLARPLDIDGGEGVVFGTPGYTAPEVYSRQYPVDQRSDIFSVGAMLYELVKGRAPKEGATSMITSLDSRLDTILAKATHLDPEQRYSDVGTFADEIDALAPLLSGPRLQTTPPPPASSPVSELKSSKSSLAPLYVTLAILLTCGAAAFFLLKDQFQSKEEKIAATTPATPVASAPVATAPELTPPPTPNPAHSIEKPAPVEKSEPKVAEVMTGPTPLVEPEPEPEKTKKEKPLASLQRLQEALVSGKRDEFPVGAINRNDSVFFLFRKKSDWQEANRIAQEFGASLASLQSSEDLRWVRDNYKLKNTLWLGGSDLGKEGQWNWVNGSTVNENLWASDSPDNDPSLGEKGQDYLGITSRGLEDFNGDDKYQALFEWKLDGSNPGSDVEQTKRAAEALSNQEAPIVPAAALHFGSSYYMLIFNEVNALDAHKACEAAKGHLAVLSSQAEADFLKDHLNVTLKKGEGIWFGAFRDEENPENWKTVTGETMAFHNWIDENGGNDNGEETFLEYTNASWRDNKGYNDSNPAKMNEGYLLEWSPKSQRNYLGSASLVSAEFEKLEEIRASLREDHARDYQRFRRKHDKLISDWVKGATRDVERMRDLEEGMKAAILAKLADADKTHKFPDNLPGLMPKTMMKDFVKTKEEIGENYLDYAEDFNEAKEDYSEALRKAGTDAGAAGEVKLVNLLTRELTAHSDNPERIHPILEGLAVPVSDGN